MHLEGLKGIEWRFGYSSREFCYEGTNIQPLTMIQSSLIVFHSLDPYQMSLLSQ